MTATRLNIGAGDRPIEGYESIDRKCGREAYPLDVPDGSVEDIYASHVLEHFSHKQVLEVLRHWVSKLQPGGRIRIAVPNFEWVATCYMQGKPINTQGYIMGGHSNDDDRHGCIFDRESLAELMALAGLERITRWEPEIADCSSLEVSLNMQGFKPISELKIENDVVGCLSAPRFGPIIFSRRCYEVLAQLRIRFMVGQGAYWHHVLEQCMDELVTRAPYVLTLDYDTIFRRDDVLNLYRVMRQLHDYDAICGVQMKRGGKSPLFVMKDNDGRLRQDVCMAEFSRMVTPVSTAHFGFTLFRSESLRKLPKPWFAEKPGPRGTFHEEGTTPPDISFWHNFTANGMKLGIVNFVSVGHLEEVIVWPDQMCNPKYQHTQDFEDNGPPANLWMTCNEDQIRSVVEAVPSGSGNGHAVRRMGEQSDIPPDSGSDLGAAADSGERAREAKEGQAEEDRLAGLSDSDKHAILNNFGCKTSDAARTKYLEERLRLFGEPIPKDDGLNTDISTITDHDDA